MMFNATRNLCLLALLAAVGLVMVGSVVDAYPASSINDYDDYFLNRRDQQIQDDELMRELYARVGNTIHFQRGSPKRTVDFGFARGFSGTQEAKHRLGLAAANYAGGPGRKRRSDDSWSHQLPAAVAVVADETA